MGVTLDLGEKRVRSTSEGDEEAEEALTAPALSALAAGPSTTLIWANE